MHLSQPTVLFLVVVRNIEIYAGKVGNVFAAEIVYPLDKPAGKHNVILFERAAETHPFAAERAVHARAAFHFLQKFVQEYAALRLAALQALAVVDLRYGIHVFHAVPIVDAEHEFIVLHQLAHALSADFAKFFQKHERGERIVVRFVFQKLYPVFFAQAA